MKLALVMMESIYPQRGGIHEQVFLLTRELKKMSFDAEIIPYSTRRVDERGKKMLWLREMSPSFISKIKGNKYDAVISETAWPIIPSILGSKLSSSPCVLHLHSVESRQDTGLSFSGKKIISFLEGLRKFCDITFVPSEIERELLKNAEILPNIIDIDAFQTVKPVELKRPAVVFVGGMGYPPNREAALSILRISEILKEKGKGNVNFYLVGPSPPPTIPPVYSTGYVESTIAYIKGADICIAPIKRGGGVKLKTLEYMASGKPIIATHKAVEGIDKINYIHAETEEEFANAIEEILKNGESMNFKENIKLVREKHSPTSAANKLIYNLKKIN